MIKYNWLSEMLKTVRTERPTYSRLFDGLQSTESQKSDTTESLTLSLSLNIFKLQT